MSSMITVKADNRRRVQIPGIKAGQVFALEDEGGKVTLTPLQKAEPKPGTVEFVKKDGYTVGVTDRTVSMETIKKLLSEFP